MRKEKQRPLEGTLVALAEVRGVKTQDHRQFFRSQAFSSACSPHGWGRLPNEPVLPVPNFHSRNTCCSADRASTGFFWIVIQNSSSLRPSGLVLTRTGLNSDADAHIRLRDQVLAIVRVLEVYGWLESLVRGGRDVAPCSTLVK